MENLKRYHIQEQLENFYHCKSFLVKDIEDRGQLKYLHLLEPDQLQDILFFSQLFESLEGDAFLFPVALKLEDFGSFQEGGKVYYFWTSEYISPSQRLDRRISELGREERFRIFRQLFEVIGELHRRGFVCGGLAPNQIFLDDEQNLHKIALLEFSAAPLAQVYFSGGDPYFFAPERLIQEPLDARADVYNLGALLYYLLSGQKPYQCSLEQKFHSPPSFSQGEFASLISTLMAPYPLERPVNCRELAKLLPSFLQPQEISWEAEEDLVTHPLNLLMFSHSSSALSLLEEAYHRKRQGRSSVVILEDFSPEVIKKFQYSLLDPEDTFYEVFCHNLPLSIFPGILPSVQNDLENISLESSIAPDLLQRGHLYQKILQKVREKFSSGVLVLYNLEKVDELSLQILDLIGLQEDLSFLVLALYCKDHAPANIQKWKESLSLREGAYILTSERVDSGKVEGLLREAGYSISREEVEAISQKARFHPYWTGKLLQKWPEVGDNFSPFSFGKLVHILALCLEGATLAQLGRIFQCSERELFQEIFSAANQGWVRVLGERVFLSFPFLEEVYHTLQEGELREYSELLYQSVEASSIAKALYSLAIRDETRYFQHLHEATLLARSLGCYSLASQLYEAALEFIPSHTSTRIQILLEYGKVLLHLQEYRSLISLYTPLLEVQLQPFEEAYVLQTLARCCWELKRFQQGEKYAKDALEKAAIAGDEDTLVQGYFVEAKILFEVGKGNLVKDLLNDAVKALQSPKYRIYLESQLAVFSIYSGEYKNAENILERLLQKAQEISHKELEGWILLLLARIYLFTSRYSRAQECIRQAGRIFLQEDHLYFYALSQLQLARFYVERYQFEEAYGPARYAYLVFEVFQESRLLWSAQSTLGEIEVEVGESVRGNRHLLRALLLANQARDSGILCELLLILGRIHLRRKDIGRAEVLIRKARELAREKNLPHLSGRVYYLSAKVARLLEESEMEKSFLEKAWEIFTKLGASKEIYKIILDKLYRDKEKNQMPDPEVLQKIQDGLEALGIEKLLKDFHSILETSAS